MKHSLNIILSLSLLVLVMAGCKKATRHEQEGWVITADPATSTLSIRKKGLETIAEQVRLNLRTGNEVTPLSGWNITKEDGKLVIATQNPEPTNWEFNITPSAIDVACSDEKGLITGNAPAGEMRIPARVQSQDNGIMYTQMGFVSATNIYNLFDMQTDIMIRFPKESSLKRNREDNILMDVEIPVTEGNEFSIIPDYYTEVIGLADYQKTDFKPVYKPNPGNFKTAPTGWCSWYNYYVAPDEEDMVAETDACAEKLKPYGLEYVQLDVCFTIGEQSSILNWNKEDFPRGGKWLFQYIKDKGLKPGLHVNAYGANYANPECADKYPEDFFLRNQEGELTRACCSPDQKRLDVTNPEVIEKHIKCTFRTLVEDWGLDYLKSAGWGQWMSYYEENRENAYNPDMDSRIAYRNLQEVVKDVLGDTTYVVGCAMKEIGIGFGIWDGDRTGHDDYATWEGEGYFEWSEGMQYYFKPLFGVNFLNGITWWCDPDNVMVRDPLTMDEGKTIVSSISLTGQAYIIGDFIAEFSKKRLQKFLHSEDFIGWAERYPDKVKALPDDKLDLYRKTMPAMPIKAMDLYPFRTEPVCCAEPSEYPRALDLKVNSETGIYDVVALFNWEDEKMEKKLDLQQDLGLESGTYLVFDFWDHRLLGTFSETIREEVPAHGTKTLIIRKVAEDPQLVATSRHLTAAYSIQEMYWKENEKSLSGISETVPGDTYTLYIHVPENYTFDESRINAENVTATTRPGNILEVSFTGRKEPVGWEVVFKSSV